MANSNRAVANRLFQFVQEHREGKAPKKLTAVNGSNFYAWLNSSVPDHMNFETIATVHSYKTEVARVVVNHTNPDPQGIHELWVSVNDYSPTTRRQLSHLHAAYHQTFPLIEPGVRSLPMYFVYLEAHLPHRCSSNRVANTYMKAVNHRNRIDQPHIHDNTRVEHVRAGIRTLEDALATTTNDVPAAYLHNFPDTVSYVNKCVALLEELTRLETLPVDEMRVSVRAMRALERH